MLKQRIIEKMIDFYEGNINDINHFLKVYTFAELIGKAENLDEETQNILELTAIVHDISCPLCRQKYGNTNGQYQESESEALLQVFLDEFELSDKVKNRIIFLVTHHHTYTNVDGIDYRILLEADYLVNAGERERYLKQIAQFRENVFKTETGRRLLDKIYGKEEDIVTSQSLHEGLNEERRREGLKDIPAVNPLHGSTNTYTRMDESYSNAFDFFRKMGKKD